MCPAIVAEQVLNATRCQVCHLVDFAMAQIVAEEQCVRKEDPTNISAARRLGMSWGTVRRTPRHTPVPLRRHDEAVFNIMPRARNCQSGNLGSSWEVGGVAINPRHWTHFRVEEAAVGHACILERGLNGFGVDRQGQALHEV